MPLVVLKLFAKQGTGRPTDKAATICFPIWRA